MVAAWSLRWSVLRFIQRIARSFSCNNDVVCIAAPPMAHGASRIANLDVPLACPHFLVSLMSTLGFGTSDRGRRPRASSQTFCDSLVAHVVCAEALLHSAQHPVSQRQQPHADYGTAVGHRAEATLTTTVTDREADASTGVSGSICLASTNECTRLWVGAGG